MKKDISLSVCIPAYNEEKSLRNAVEDLKRTLRPAIEELEIIIVDDGSRDSTPQKAEQIAQENPGIKVLHHHKNQGIGACYRSALSAAKCSYYTWFPGDHENDAEEFLACLPHIEKKTIVTCHHTEHDPRPFLRRLISRTYTFFLNRYFGYDLKYYNGLSIFPREVVQGFKLTADGFLFTAETLIIALKEGYRIKELSFALKKRKHGRSKLFTFRGILQVFSNIKNLIKLKDYA